jgi:hypothetical protein
MTKGKQIISKKVLQIGLESLVEDAIKGKKKELKNISEVISATLNEVYEQEGIKLQNERTIDHPTNALNMFEEIVTKRGLKGARQFTKKWTKADFYTVIEKALSKYSRKINKLSLRTTHPAI